MTLKSHAKFEEKLAYGLENDLRNLANFYQNIWKCHNWFFHGIILSKVEHFMMPESDAKFEEKETCGLENDMEDLANFHQSTQKSQNSDFYWVFLSKAENVWA